MLPVMFLSHGGGPCWLMDGSEPGNSRIREMDKNSKSADFMKNLRTSAGLPRAPDAILVVSAHWEEDEFTVQSSERPALLYDYTDFPEFTYHLKWPVPGAPKIADRVRNVLNETGVKCLTTETRGLDHGVFVPLMLAYPEADVPVLELSLRVGLSIAEHLAVGEALGKLRSENVLIVGSGQSTHNLDVNNLSGFVPPWCNRFRDWFHDVMTNTSYTPQERKQKLLDSDKETTFYDAHPTIEHYLPGPVMCAVAGYAPGRILYDEIVLNAMVMSTIKFD